MGSRCMKARCGQNEYHTNKHFKNDQNKQTRSILTCWTDRTLKKDPSKTHFSPFFFVLLYLVSHLSTLLLRPTEQCVVCYILPERNEHHVPDYHIRGFYCPILWCVLAFSYSTLCIMLLRFHCASTGISAHTVSPAPYVHLCVCACVSKYTLHQSVCPWTC